MRSPHWSFWAFAVVTLLFNVAGCVNFTMQLNAASLASMPEAVRALVASRPVWATAGFAVAVFGGALGGAVLLARKSAARFLFGLSAIGACLTLLHLLELADSRADTTAFFMGNSSQLIVSLFLLWYTEWATRRSWIA